MSKAAELADELRAITRQIDGLEGGEKLELGERHQGSLYMKPFHPRAAETVRAHAVAILKGVRAELLVEVAKEVGLPARFEEATEEIVVVQHPPIPSAVALPKDES